MQDSGLVFVEDDKCGRCVTVGRSWYGMTLAKLVRKYSLDDKFKKDWDRAVEIYNNMADSGHDWGLPLAVKTLNRTGMTSEAVYWFLRISEFLRRYKHDPKKLKIPVISLTKPTRER